MNKLISITIILMFSLLLFIVYGDNGLADLNQLKTARDSIVKRNKDLFQNNLSLFRQMKRLEDDPKYIENIARQEFGMIGKNEIIFKIIQIRQDSESKTSAAPFITPQQKTN